MGYVSLLSLILDTRKSCCYYALVAIQLCRLRQFSGCPSAAYCVRRPFVRIILLSRCFMKDWTISVTLIGLRNIH